MEELQPDTVLILGDTNSCLCAIAAKRRHIPIFHMEAGNRCFDQRVPEETNRRIDTLRPVADYSMPNVLDKVLRIILSYTDYVNRVVWRS